jgi:hypothetical protein
MLFIVIILVLLWLGCGNSTHVVLLCIYMQFWENYSVISLNSFLSCCLHTFYAHTCEMFLSTSNPSSVCPSSESAIRYWRMIVFTIPSQFHSGGRRWVYLFAKGLGSTCLDQRHDIDEELLLDFTVALITRLYKTRRSTRKAYRCTRRGLHIGSRVYRYGVYDGDLM